MSRGADLTPTERQEIEAGIAALATQRATLGDAVVDAALAALRERLAGLPAAAAVEALPQALRQVSILFLDVVGSTTLGQRLDPEEIGEWMDGLLSRATRIVQEHRGKVLQYAGDSLLAAFGADEASEDDAERAVRCGLALRELGQRFGAELRAAQAAADGGVRVGIHTGGVLLGGGVDADGTIRGQAVNIAARMEQTAPTGALRISHDTYRFVRGIFDIEAQAPLHVKGVDESVRSYLVLRAKPRAFKVTTRGIEGVETRMIGRDAEFETLQGAFLRLVQPGAGLQRVLVVAEAGLGKSRLLYEFGNWAEARTERCYLFQARATPQTRSQPYGLLRELFAWRWQILDDDGLELARRKLEAGVQPLFDDIAQARMHAHLLGQLIGLDYGASPHIRGIRDDALQIRNRGFAAAALVLRRLSAQGKLPIVVQLDDLHWADDGSLDFVDYLAHVDQDVPMLLLTLARPTLLERRPHDAETAGQQQTIVLHPLDRGSCRQLADELLQKLPAIPSALRELVSGGAEGNPFYMEELVKMLVDQGVIAIGETRWALQGEKLLSLQVPPTLTGVLQARLDGLPSDERRALQLASVIGLKFWDAALAHVDAGAAAQLPSLQRRDLVRATDASAVAVGGIREFAFSHQLLHQVTYDTVLRRERRDAHARVAQWLAQHAGALSLSLLGTAAEHYERAGDAARAAEFYTRAAEHMAGIFAHDAALDFTARALALLAEDAADLRWRLLANRERVLDMLGRRDAQRDDIESMHALAAALPAGRAGDARRADVAWRRADIAHRTGDWGLQEREARRARALAERAGDEALALRATQRLAQSIAYQGDPAGGLALAQPALARARALDLPAEMSRLMNALTVCTDLLGDRVAGLKQSLQDLALDREIGHRRNEAVALSNVGMSYLGFGAFDEARGYLEEALRLNRELGNRQIEGNTHSMLSELAWREGRDTAALGHARAAYDISVEVASRLHQVDSLWSLGNAELALGRWEAAADAFERSESIALEIGVAPQRLNAIDGQIRVALARGSAVQAARLAARLQDAAVGADAAAPSIEATDAAARAPASSLLAGTYEHLIRLGLHRAALGEDAARADALLAEAHAALRAEADRIHDAALRDSFLTRIAEHEQIVAAMTRRLQSAPREA